MKSPDPHKIQETLWKQSWAASIHRQSVFGAMSLVHQDRAVLYWNRFSIGMINSYYCFLSTFQQHNLSILPLLWVQVDIFSFLLILRLRIIASFSRCRWLCVRVDDVLLLILGYLLFLLFRQSTAWKMRIKNSKTS